MEKVPQVSRGFQPSRKKSKIDPSQSPESVARPTLGVARPFICRTSSLYYICFLLFFGTTCSPVISAQGVSNFTVPSTSYVCSSNIICLGQAHVSNGGSTGLEAGRLSLLSQAYQSSGIAYYNDQVKLLDLPSRQLASFSTSFTIDVRWSAAGSKGGDGMTFILSANNTFLGIYGSYLGVFDESYSTPFKCIIIEFDIYDNAVNPIDDISDNHVSFDFMNITARAAANASKVNVDLSDQSTKYVWVEYNRDSQQLEVRVSYNMSKPVEALLSYTVDISDFVEEYMWAGFTSASGGSYSNYYIGNWSFESYGIPVPSPTLRKSKSHGNMLDIIVGMSVGVPVFLLACIGLLVRRRYRASGHLGLPEEDLTMKFEGMPERYSYKQLSVATRAFSEEMKLGNGGFGSVYRGELPSSGVQVAVKRINSDSNQGEKEFMAEVSIISQLRHRNLIQLRGWCKDASKKKYLLVYEFMPNGSLDKALFQPVESQQPCLSWKQRFNIVTGTAAALDYLHQGWKQKVIHRDVKSSNIMLDEDWNAKLGDFGLARLVDHWGAAATTLVAGTYGYIAPEATSGRFTDKTDVFAFGAVVLEIACGRRALESLGFTREPVILVDMVWQSLSEGCLLSTVDKQLVDYDIDWMEILLIVGLLCSHPNPLARPSMRHVVQILAGDAPVPSIPVKKPAPFNYDPRNLPNEWQFSKSMSLKSGSSSGSRSISLVSLSNSDSTRGSTLKSLGSSSNESYTS